MMKKKAAAPAAAQCLCMGMGPKLTELLQCRSEAASGHLRTARIEFLKAVRALIDERIQQLGATGKRRGTTVPVE
jgi:hypothetical protein